MTGPPVKRGPGQCLAQIDDNSNGSVRVSIPPSATAQRSKPTPPCMALLEFKPLVKNTLRGFAVLDVPPGIIVREFSIHEKNGKRWASLPAKPMLDADGKQIVNHAGHKQYAAPLGWRTRELADRFSARVIELVIAAHPNVFEGAR
jgi:hypothetical protein